MYMLVATCALQNPLVNADDDSGRLAFAQRQAQLVSMAFGPQLPFDRSGSRHCCSVPSEQLSMHTGACIQQTASSVWQSDANEFSQRAAAPSRSLSLPESPVALAFFSFARKRLLAVRPSVLS